MSSTEPDDALRERLRAENRLLRSRYDVAAWHCDLHAHAAQQAMRERDAALAKAAQLEAELDEAKASRWRRKAATATSPDPQPASIASTQVVIISRDRLDCLQRLMTWLESAEGVGQIHIVDNASTWQPLVEYLHESPHTVHWLGVNLGHHAPWITGLISEISQSRFVVTDPDVVPDESCPPDVIPHLHSILDRFPDVDKVGLGLRIDDLPDDFPRRASVIDWESQYWRDEVEPGVFKAAVDTTFALYRAGRDHKSFSALRTGAPYVAQHLSWYVSDASRSDEDRYYEEHADPSIASWTGPGLSLLYRQDDQQ